MKNICVLLALLLAISFAPKTLAQTAAAQSQTTFEKIEMLISEDGKLREVEVKIRFENDSVIIESAKNGTVLKKFANGEFKSAEYSYTKSPRWKSGLALGAASVAFFPLAFIAIPLGFSKHRRHWLTVRTEKDYAVLKIGKSVRKIFMPAFEVQTNTKIEALGETK